MGENTWKKEGLHIRDNVLFFVGDVRWSPKEVLYVIGLRTKIWTRNISYMQQEWSARFTVTSGVQFNDNNSKLWYANNNQVGMYLL